MKNEVLNLSIEELETVVAFGVKSGLVTGFVAFNIVSAVVVGAAFVIFT